MWGLRDLLVSALQRLRSIPTHVGFTSRYPGPPRPRPVHPHACGVYEMRLSVLPVTVGPSPRMWGLPRTSLEWPAVYRSIPTHVGFTKAKVLITSVTFGPSPRMWGLRRIQSALELLQRSIPTHVGFTTPRHMVTPPTTVHPHACGVYPPTTYFCP